MFKKLLGDLLGGLDGDDKKKEEQENLRKQQLQQEENDDDDDDDNYDDDDEDDYYEEELSDAESREILMLQVKDGVQLDPETLHGKHYTKTEFEGVAEKFIQEQLNDPDLKQYNYTAQMLRPQALKDAYQYLTGASPKLVTMWDMQHSLENSGFSTSFNAKEDPNNPLLQPIHGINLKDYSAMCGAGANGSSEAEISKAMGIDKVLYEEVNALWTKRMQEDMTFTIAALMGNYFAEASSHPKLAHLFTSQSSGTTNQENVERLRTDKYFYAELCGARAAAYDYGMDGAQWIVENFGIPLGDFQSAAMVHMQANNASINAKAVTDLMEYQDEMQKVYADKFAAEQGGNVADDIEF